MDRTSGAASRQRVSRPSEWSNGPHDRYAVHEHGYDKVIIVVAGGIVFAVDGGRATIALFPGDRLELPAGTTHGAVVSPMGVTCLEAHLPAGSLPGHAPRRRPAGDW